MLEKEIRSARRQLEKAERLARVAEENRKSHNLGVPRCPLILRIEVTNRCNSNCVFCPYQNQKRPKSSMSSAVFRLAIDQYTALGGRAINFSPVVGEALLDENLEDKVAYVRQFPQYLKLELYTNGILLTRQRFEALVSAGINQFHIALSGFSADEYKRVYRTNNYDKVFKNLTEIAGSKTLKQVSVVVHVRTDSLHPQCSPDYQKIHRFGVFSIILSPNVMSWHGAIKQKDLPGHMFLVAGLRDQWKPCFQLWGGLAVLADGRLTLCGCTDMEGTGLPLGNIKSVALDAHLQDGRWLRLRDSFIQGNPPKFCKGCDAYWPYGCDESCCSDFFSGGGTREGS